VAVDATAIDRTAGRRRHRPDGRDPAGGRDRLRNGKSEKHAPWRPLREADRAGARVG